MHSLPSDVLNHSNVKPVCLTVLKTVSHAGALRFGKLVKFYQISVTKVFSFDGKLNSLIYIIIAKCMSVSVCQKKSYELIVHLSQKHLFMHVLLMDGLIIFLIL